MSDAEAIIRWLFVLTAAGAAFAPAVWWLGDGLGHAASALVRPLGVVFLTAIAWWPAAATGVPFREVTLMLILLVAGAALWVVWLRRGLHVPWRSLVAFESVWLLLFSAYAFFRAYQPDIANTEKPMEIALLSSISRSTEVPAPDPWFAGEAINYYYFGYQTIASLVKLSGVPPAIAFNLALATLFASVGTIAAGIGYVIARKVSLPRTASLLTGALAAFLVLLAGNLEAASRLIRNPGDTWRSGWWYDDVGWEASRIIVDIGVHGRPEPRQTINEFPAFSFVLGDLHPHVLTYPMLLAVLAVALGFMFSEQALRPGAVVVSGALAGLLYVSNSWDAPLGLLLIGVGILVAGGWKARRSWSLVGIAAGSALLAASPFILTFTAPVGVNSGEVPAAIESIPVLGRVVGTLGIVTWRPSSFAELVTVHGVWVAALVVFAALIAVKEWRIFDELRAHAAPVALALVIAIVLALAWAPAVAVIGLPLALALYIAIRASKPASRAVALLFTAGFALILVPEFVYIQDAFGDRMNTVFKLYFQAWALLALATAGTLAIAIQLKHSAVRIGSFVALSILVLVTLPYTPISARDWTGNFAKRQGLDGSAYISRAAPGDFALIGWLNEYAAAGAVIVEGPGCSYQGVGGVPMNRVSAFTGIPTLIGWEGHEGQWRRGEGDDLGERIHLRQDIANRWLAGEEVLSFDLPLPDYIILGAQESTGSDTCEPLAQHDIDASREQLERQGWAVVFESGNNMILAR